MEYAPRTRLTAHDEAVGDVNDGFATPKLRATVPSSNAGDVRTSITERTGTRYHTSNPVRPFRFSVNCPNLIASTQHLTAAAMGALMRLKLHYWISGPIPDDDDVLMRITGTLRKEWTAIRPHIEGRFDIVDGQWIHWRLDEQIEEAYSAINRNRAKTQAATRARAAKRRNERTDINERQHDGADGGNSCFNTDCDLDPITSFASDILKAEQSMGKGATDHDA